MLVSEVLTMPGTGLLCHLAGVLKPQNWPFQNWGCVGQSGGFHSRLCLLITPTQGWTECSEKLLFELLDIIYHSKIGGVSGDGDAARCVRLFQLLYGHLTPEDPTQLCHVSNVLTFLHRPIL